MRQILFEIPGTGIQVFGFGMMLFLAFLAAMNLAAWRARRSRIDPEIIYDLAFWLILGGLIGARAFYVLQHGESIESFWDIFKVWKGGIVLYGSGLGAAAGYLSYWLWRRFPIRPVMDAIAPAIALGIALGRVGCFLNGCCYGDVCEHKWAVQFPAGTLPWAQHVGLLEEYIELDREREQVESGREPWPAERRERHEALAEQLGLNGDPEDSVVALEQYIRSLDYQEFRRLRYDRVRDGLPPPDAPPNSPRSLPVHPTQLYSALDGLILMTLLLAYYPLRRRDGEVMALLILTYPVTRFLIERLRNDEEAFYAGLTISQNISIGLFVIALAFWLYLCRWPTERYEDRPEDSETTLVSRQPAIEG
ncbi:prolipoprotein diacylglyceryl transferase [soil metagenome]